MPLSEYIVTVKLLRNGVETRVWIESCRRQTAVKTVRKRWRKAHGPNALFTAVEVAK